ncbi:hypothetical protein [Oceanobacillus aidingensis]|uniref:Response regulatory domain-containing protein n=1 Tax=Oceanobacillus aidingensis TaxID=645964 RepID=A0ABV9JSM6_9BACI
MSEPIHILVVEDDNDINQLLCNIIRISGYFPQAAFSLPIFNFWKRMTFLLKQEKSIFSLKNAASRLKVLMEDFFELTIIESALIGYQSFFSLNISNLCTRMENLSRVTDPIYIAKIGYFK